MRCENCGNVTDFVVSPTPDQTTNASVEVVHIRGKNEPLIQPQHIRLNDQVVSKSYKSQLTRQLTLLCQERNGVINHVSEMKAPVIPPGQND